MAASVTRPRRQCAVGKRKGFYLDGGEINSRYSRRYEFDSNRDNG